jgi:prevent-host-death family protein
MPHIYPVSDLKNNLTYLNAVCRNEHEPVYLTRRGHGKLVLLGLEEYEKLLSRVKTIEEEAPHNFAGQNRRCLTQRFLAFCTFVESKVPAKGGSVLHADSHHRSVCASVSFTIGRICRLRRTTRKSATDFSVAD